MTIAAGTEMLLFRYNNYKSYSFIKEHQSFLDKNEYVWMLKLGKKSSIDKINAIKAAGGWIVLRAPKSEGGVSYIASFTDYSENEPDDGNYPEYYNEILYGLDDEESFDIYDPAFQWFKLRWIRKLDEESANNLVVSKTGKRVEDVVETTRTAVMYIKNMKNLNL